MNVSFITIYSKNIERSKAFYESVGLSFNQEQHGDDGLVHYSCELDNTVFEIYPQNTPYLISSSTFTLGLKVEGPVFDGLEFPEGIVFKRKKNSVIVFDPDFNKIFLKRKPAFQGVLK